MMPAIFPSFSTGLTKQKKCSNLKIKMHAFELNKENSIISITALKIRPAGLALFG